MWVFFDQLYDMMCDDCLLVLVECDGRLVVGVLNLLGLDVVFGCYWGCIEDYLFLYFELCYYCVIDWVIVYKLVWVEVGVQGEYKLVWGYLFSQIYLLYWVCDQGFYNVIVDYLICEWQVVSEEMVILIEMGLFWCG